MADLNGLSVITLACFLSVPWNRSSISIFHSGLIVGNYGMFEPGQRVICVDDRFPDGIRDIFNALPVKGTTYVVRDLVPGIGWKLKEEPAIYLVELVNHPNAHGIEPGFACWRFAEPEEEENTEYAHATAEQDDGEEWKIPGLP